jgi:diguanylate cyclase (GGDEF)-like protein/putative nucleotidyltransferase with HDIG domain
MNAKSVGPMLYIAAVGAAGAWLFGTQFRYWEWIQPLRFLTYLAAALAGSTLKVQLPGITGSVSVNFLVFLMAMLELPLPQALAIGSAGAVFQSLWQARRRPRPVELAFNAAAMSLAVGAGDTVYHSIAPGAAPQHQLLALCLAASVFFAVNTFLVAAVIALTERKPLRLVWKECYFWSFPYHLGGGAVAWMYDVLRREGGWQALVVVVPLSYVIYHSYRLYLGRLETERKHAADMAELHLRTIEALALAIEAKDHTTHHHLRRVQVYAVEIGRELGLRDADLEALRAASLLHDIGKLAVPEHIISKPGRLTPEEFEKMKIHPAVGAEILERVNFPYPVVPIVRAHHERWDGSGYPDGLRGEQIPFGARILAAVDCLDALASDRQYRRALPLKAALNHVASQAGKAYDPRVVEVLKRRCLELERLAYVRTGRERHLLRDVKSGNHAEPAAGFAGAAAGSPPATDFLASIAAARQEVQTLFELANDLGNSLSLDETLSLLAVRLKRLIPYDAIAIYVRRDLTLFPEYVNGEDFRLFSSLEIPVGEGVSGWVAQNREPILNGNPSVEPGYLNDPTRFSLLRSALAVPLEGANSLVGVLTLYQAERDAFTADHLRVLLAVSYKVALAIENALKYRQAESSATTDYLSTLPNARSLFLHLDSELARSKRRPGALTVLVCDLDGFKDFNDRYGHLEGNRLLRAVALGLKESCREYDYVARMGGDEFVLVLPDVAPDALRSRIRHLQDVVAEAARRVVPGSVLSLSVGAADFPADGADAEQLLTVADRRMYHCKQRRKRPAPARAASLPTGIDLIQ